VNFSLLFSCIFFVSKVFKDLKEKYRGLITLFFVIIVFFHMKSIAEGLLWFASANTYTLSASIFIFLITLIYDCTCVNKNWIIYIIFFVLSLALVGSNESSLLVIIFLQSTLLTDRLFHRDKKGIINMTIILIVSIATALFSIKAPGNTVRLQYFPESGLLFQSLSGSLIETVKFFNFYFSKPWFLLFSILIFLVTLQNSEKDNPKYDPQLILIFLFLTVWLSIFPSYWSMGDVPFDRVFNLIHILFIVIWVVFVKNLSIIAVPLKYKSFRIIVRVLSTMLFFLLVNNNYLDLITDSIENAPLYNKEVSSRYEFLKNNIGKELVLPTIKHYPITFHNADISKDPDNWVNDCYEDYFHVKSVKLE